MAEKLPLGYRMGVTALHVAFGSSIYLAVQAFSAWIHICAIRLFAESILRYGLPPKFLAALLKPNQKSTVRLRKVLGSLFGNSGNPKPSG